MWIVNVLGKKNNEKKERMEGGMREGEGIDYLEGYH